MAVAFKKHVLSNGMRVVAEEDPNAASAAVGFFVHSGARDEPADVMGISHLLEHMVFKGTAQRSGEEIDAAFDDLGVHHNAWTSHEITAFHAHGLPDVLKPALTILADIMRPALRESDLEDERAVVLEEIAMYEDQPFWQLWEAVSENYFAGDPMGHRVLGTVDTVSSIDAQTMQSWHADRYVTENTVLAMAGQLDFEEVCAHLESLIGHWPGGGVTRVCKPHQPASDHLTIESDRVSAGYMLSVAPAPALQDEDRHAAAVLAWLFGRGDGSRLHWALVDHGLAEEAQCAWEGHDRCGQFVTWAICEPEKLPHVCDVIAQEHDRFIDSLQEADLMMARSMIRTAVTVHGEMPAGRMQRLGRMYATLGTHVPLEEELKKLDALTLDDLRATATQWPLRGVVEGRLVPVRR